MNRWVRCVAVSAASLAVLAVAPAGRAQQPSPAPAPPGSTAPQPGSQPASATPPGASAAPTAHPPPPPPGTPPPLPMAPWEMPPPAQGAAPPDQAIPSHLSLDEAIRLFDTRGYDLLVADAQIKSAEADLTGASAVANPSLSLIYGRVLGYDPSQQTQPGPNNMTVPCDGCSANQYTVGVSDNAAILDLLVNKRGLRKDVARMALAATRIGKEDVKRQLEVQIKTQYVAIATAIALRDFNREIVKAWEKSVKFNQDRYPGMVDEGVLARVQTAKLSADQDLDRSELAIRAARVQLAYFLGARGYVSEFDVDQAVATYTVPERLQNASVESLERAAIEHRPDLKVIAYEKQHAEAELALAQRTRFPDISLSAQYTQTGTGQAALAPPTISIGVSAPIPIFYQNQGDIAHAQADKEAQLVQERKTLAQIHVDVQSAFDAFLTSRRLIERIQQGGLLERAKRARDITEIQFNAGKGGIYFIDYLDAQRTFIATKQDELNNLNAYWTAVFQLEQAVGADLRR